MGTGLRVTAMRLSNGSGLVSAPRFSSKMLEWIAANEPPYVRSTLSQGPEADHQLSSTLNLLTASVSLLPLLRVLRLFKLKHGNPIDRRASTIEYLQWSNYEGLNVPSDRRRRRPQNKFSERSHDLGLKSRFTDYT